jgi:hypothetical protein
MGVEGLPNAWRFGAVQPACVICRYTRAPAWKGS